MAQRILSLTLASFGLVTGMASAQNPKVSVKTTHGTIVVELYSDKAPKTVENFLAYVDAKHYDGTIFHRVIPRFMIQGGGFTAAMQQKATQAPVQNEAKNGLSNERGTIAMARTSDPHSATSQFFINTVDNDGLDQANSQDGWGYTVFGKVSEGLDVVDAISAVKTTSKGAMRDVPADTVSIESVTRQ